MSKRPSGLLTTTTTTSCYHNFTAMSMAVSPGCLDLSPATLAGVFFEPHTECVCISEQLHGPDLQLQGRSLCHLMPDL